MLACFAPRMPDIVPSAPGMSRRMTHSRAAPPSDPSPQARSSQSASIPLASVSQPMTWTSISSSSRRRPTIRSPGIGWQQVGEVIGDARGQALDRDRLALAQRARRATSPPAEPGISASINCFVGDSLARDGDHQLVVVLDLELLERALQRILVELGGKASDDFVVDLAAELDGFLALLVADEAAHAGARLAGGDEAQPRRLRMLRLRSEDFDLVAILEHRPQRHDAAVDLGADGAVAEVGVDGVGEIDRGRALGQLDQLALRGEGEDAVLVHRHPRMLEQLFGAFGVVEDFDQVVDPRDVQVGLRLAFLVGPVGGEAAFGLLVHRAIADLDFDPHLRIVDDRGVQASIAVALGRRDVILEAARDHRPALMDQARARDSIRRRRSTMTRNAMTSDNCSKLMCRSAIFFQIEKGCFSRPMTSASSPLSAR